MQTDQEITHCEGVRELDVSAADRQRHPLTLEPAEKGSLRSMWELLMQLRVLLPYLTRLVPLLDRGLLKAAPDLSEVHKGMQDLDAGNHDLGLQLRSQGLQLERMEEQLLRLREIGEHSQKEARERSEKLASLAAWVRSLTILCGLILTILIAMAALQLSH